MENILTTQKEISIFKTSVLNHVQVALLSDVLNAIVGVDYWNFDLEDKDNILRIEANTVINNFLIQEISKLGFECEELF